MPHLRTNLQARDRTDTEPEGSGAVGAAGGGGVRLSHPSPEDGPHMWRLAGETGMDVNSPYAYALWCRDFATTSVVARDDEGRVAAYVTGFVRPESPDTYFLWQVAVDSAYRGQGLARRMLDFVGDRIAERGLRYLEATVTADNTASRALFTSFARGRGTEAVWSPLFTGEHFPRTDTPHDPEDLVRIGPLGPETGA